MKKPKKKENNSTVGPPLQPDKPSGRKRERETERETETETETERQKEQCSG